MKNAHYVRFSLHQQGQAIGARLPVEFSLADRNLQSLRALGAVRRKGNVFRDLRQDEAQARSAAPTVFSSSIVTVIGPTPPGTGVM